MNIEFINTAKSTRSGFCKQVNVVTYEGRFTHKNTLYHCGTHQTVRSAQIAVDRKRLELGLDALVLKPKINV